MVGNVTVKLDRSFCLYHRDVFFTLLGESSMTQTGSIRTLHITPYIYPALFSLPCSCTAQLSSKAWDTLQDSTDNSNIDKAKTSLDWQEYFSQHRDTTDVLPCHIHLPVCLWIIDPHSRALKKNKSHGKEVLLQNTTHLIQRPCYQRGSPCQDPEGNWTARRLRDYHKETHTAVVWSCLPFIRSG